MSEFLAFLVVIDVHHLVPLGRAWICVIMREQVLHDLSTGVVVSLEFAHSGCLSRGGDACVYEGSRLRKCKRQYNQYLP